MTDLETELSRLRERIAEDQAAAAQAQARHAVAVARVEAAESQLQAEFEVAGVEQAQRLEEALQADLAQEVGRVRKLLEEAGG